MTPQEMALEYSKWKSYRQTQIFGDIQSPAAPKPKNKDLMPGDLVMTGSGPAYYYGGSLNEVGYPGASYQSYAFHPPAEITKSRAFSSPIFSIPLALP